MSKLRKPKPDAAEVGRPPLTNNTKQAVQINNTKILRKMGYSVGKTIGEGTYSRVCIAQNLKSQSEKACKIIHKKLAGGEFIKRFLPRELKILAMIAHPNIISVSDIIEIHDVIYIFMDYCRNGDLLEFIRSRGPLTENRAKHYFRDIVSAVEYLHCRNLAHRDLKCENVLLTMENSVKLGDFGFARSCVNEKNLKVMSRTFCGSAAYAAPEILQGIPYDPKMYDIWALGCILYIMLTASMPFDDSNIKKMLKSQMEKRFAARNVLVLSIHTQSLLRLLQSLLEPNVHKRAPIHQVAKCEWFREQGGLLSSRRAVSNTQKSNKSN